MGPADSNTHSSETATWEGVGCEGTRRPELGASNSGAEKAACPVPEKRPRSQAACPPESATNLLRAALKALKSPFCRYRSILPLRLWGGVREFRGEA